MIHTYQQIDPLTSKYQKEKKSYITTQEDSVFIKRDVRESLDWLVLRAKGLDKKPRILDLGCRTGYCLDLLQSEKYGCIAMGIESIKSYVEFGVGRGRNIIHGDASYCHEYFPENYFDGVLASHILEHLDDPTLALLNLRKVVKPKASCLIFIPREGKGSSFSKTPKNVASKHRSNFPTEAAIREVVPPCWHIKSIVATGQWQVALVAA